MSNGTRMTGSARAYAWLTVFCAIALVSNVVDVLADPQGWAWTARAWATGAGLVICLVWWAIAKVREVRERRRRTAQG